ncbi:MAG TPA: hypothetical protein VGT61_12610 [Thermomicrobiales bacterium]|jgi:hypothetical protein|nr:hypothetical protein [Thermomicrobiales bacterium]
MPLFKPAALLLSTLALVLGLLLSGVASTAAQSDDDPDGDGTPFNTAFIGSANQSDDDDDEADSDDLGFNPDFIGSADDGNGDRPPREPAADTVDTDTGANDESEWAVESMPNTGAGMVDSSPALMTVLIGAFAAMMLAVAGGSAVRGLRGSVVRSR